VTQALILLDFSTTKAAVLTTAVDKQGAATLYTTNDTTLIETVSDLLFNHNLLFSFIPVEIVKLENNFVALLQWIQNLGNSNGGIRNIMANMLMINITELPVFTSVIDGVEEDDEATMSNANAFAPNLLFEIKNQFPSVLTHLLPDSVHIMLNTTDTSTTTFWSEYLSEYARPFDNNNCPPVVFALLMLSHPFMGKVGKNALNSLIIHFQHDSYFKFGFSELFMLLYPALYSLFIRFVGTEDGHIFSTTVQVFTANSIIDCLSSDDANLRIFNKYNNNSNISSSNNNNTNSNNDNNNNNNNNISTINLTQQFAKVLNTCLSHMGGVSTKQVLLLGLVILYIYILIFLYTH
jgi:hypothetical protein